MKNYWTCKYQIWQQFHHQILSSCHSKRPEVFQFLNSFFASSTLWATSCYLSSICVSLMGKKKKKKDTLCICQVYNSTYNTELQMQVLGFIPCVGALSYCYINVIIIYFYIPALYTLHKNRAPSKNSKISVIHFKSYEAQKFSISIFCIINVIICHHFLWRNIQV